MYTDDMRILFKSFLLVVLITAALPSPVIAAPQASASGEVSITFRHRTAEGVLFETRLQQTNDGATYEAFLAEGEHITERSGKLSAARWKAIVAKAAPLVGPNTAREVSSSDACYEVVVTQGDTSQTARFVSPADDRERSIVGCFESKTLLGRIYASLTGGIQSH